MVPGWVTERVGAERWEAVAGGYTRAGKWLATLPDGTKVFVKAAEDDLGVRLARVELLVYTGVHGPFLPRVVDSWQGGDRALLVLEDLSSAYWPPPYPEDTRPVFDSLAAVARTEPPPDLRRLETLAEPPWAAMSELGVCSADWLDRALDALEDAIRAFDVTGDDLVHFDVWSDNMCFADRGVVLIDWAAARVGNRWIDVGYALLSILAEGGNPPAFEIPEEASLAAFIAGSVVHEAAAPLPAWAQPGSTLREDQRGDLAHALTWAAEALGLDPPR